MTTFWNDVASLYVSIEIEIIQIYDHLERRENQGFQIGQAFDIFISHLQRATASNRIHMFVAITDQSCPRWTEPRFCICGCVYVLRDSKVYLEFQNKLKLENSQNKKRKTDR